LAGRGSLFIVGGAESMSQMPLLFNHAAAKKFAAFAKAKSLPQRVAAISAFRPGDFEPRIGLKLGLTDPGRGFNMGEEADVLARNLGTVTAGNSSQITDGAVALLVASEERAAELGMKPLGRLVAYSYVGCDPARMGLGPVGAIKKVNEQSGLTLDQADVVEI